MSTCITCGGRDGHGDDEDVAKDRDQPGTREQCGYKEREANLGVGPAQEQCQVEQWAAVLDSFYVDLHMPFAQQAPTKGLQ